MKDWIQNVYGGADKLFKLALKRAVQEAWDAVTPDILEEIMATMHDRCKAVIEAEGRYTEW